MSYKGYTFELHYSSADKCFHGRVVGIRDLVHFEASSADEVEQAFKDSVDVYLEFCEESGQPPERPQTEEMVIKADSALRRRIVELANARGISVDRWIVDALEAQVSEQGSETYVFRED